MSNQLLGERYRVVKVLSQGIFCQTYTVEDTYLSDRPICILKHFLPSSRCAIPVEIRRRLFIREIEALAKLGECDSVPNLLDSFEDNLEFYLVQEFIEGHPLSAELLTGQRWSEGKVLQMLQQMLSILDFVHNHGLIHRDVKPNNILRRKQDHRLILIDFGAVKPIWNELFADTNTTIAIGTPGYMPYEQELGKPRPSSDIYALGMIAIQALTGVHPTKLPEDGHTGEVIWQHLALVSPELAAVVNKMVHYRFQDRYQSAKEVLDALLPLANFHTSIPQMLPTLPPPEMVLEVQTLSAQQEVISVPKTVSSQLESWIVFSGEQDLKTEEQTINNTTIAVFSKKTAWLIGLILGTVSGAIIMIVSYWSVQIVSPVPRMENLQLQQPRLFR